MYEVEIAIEKMAISTSYTYKYLREDALFGGLPTVGRRSTPW